jgi:PKD repeat protein
MARAMFLLMLVLSVVFVVGQYTIAPVAYAWHDPNYVSPPPGEIVRLKISEIPSINMTGSLDAEVAVYGFQNFDAAVGLCLLKGSWDCAWGWGSVRQDSSTRIRVAKAGEGFTAIGIPLWLGTARWIQSIDIDGFRQVCTMALMPPKIREVREEWINERIVRLSIYINSPGRRGSFTARIYYGGREVYYVYKNLELNVSITACHTLMINVGPVTFLKDGVYTVRVEYSSDVGRDAVEKSVRVGRQYQVKVRAVHVDGSAATGTRVCVSGLCQYADHSGVAVFQLSEGSYVVRAEKEYDVAGTKIRYSGVRNIYVSSDMSLDVELSPERCLYLRQFRLNCNEAAPGGVVSGYAEFVLAKCCANCTAHLVVYDWNYREITRLWDGQIEAHRVITRSFSLTAPNTPGTYCVSLNFFLGPYTTQKLPPGEEVGRACFTVKETPKCNATTPAGFIFVLTNATELIETLNTKFSLYLSSAQISNLAQRLESLYQMLFPEGAFDDLRKFLTELNKELKLNLTSTDIERFLCEFSGELEKARKQIAEGFSKDVIIPTNYTMLAKREESAPYFHGRTLLVFIMIDDKKNWWNARSERVLYRKISQITEFLENKAPKDAKVSFIIRVHRIKVDFLPSYEICRSIDLSIYAWMNEAVRKLGYRDVDDMAKRLKAETQADNVVLLFILHWNHPSFGGCALPAPYWGYGERAIVFFFLFRVGGIGVPMDSRVYVHEILHLFGALDQYLPCTNCKSEFAWPPLGELWPTTTRGRPACMYEQKPCCVMCDPWFCNDVSLTTRGQIGWGDYDKDGVLDPVDPDPRDPRIPGSGGVRAEIYVTNATIPVGGAGVVRVVLDRAPGGLSGFSLRFTTRTAALLPGYCPPASLCAPADVRIEGVKFPEWAGLNDWRRIDEYTVELKAVDLRDAVKPGAQNVVLAEITVRALTPGVAVAWVINATIDDDSGRPVAVVIRPGVIYVSGCPRPVAGVVPRDLDGDGLYEDLNGNGRLDYDDVVRLFRYFDDPAIRECWQLYDFNRNGRLDYDDIVALFRKVP